MKTLGLKLVLTGTEIFKDAKLPGKYIEYVPKGGISTNRNQLYKWSRTWDAKKLLPTWTRQREILLRLFLPKKLEHRNV